MRAIDYFDRGHDMAPDHPCLIDAESGETLSFAQVRALTLRIAAALHAAGFRDQQPIALYGPNSATMMVALLAIWRANGQWVPVNTRNAIDANAAYLAYVRCGWLFYHSSQGDDVAQLKARVPGLTRFICLDRPWDGDPSLDQFIANGETNSLPDFSDPFGKPDDIVGLFPPAAPPVRPRGWSSPTSAGAR
ncbi:AMP-binding protein [Sphingobium sp. CAP-1]|uniref:AMP-binding protein n=1 Tax=Sphingobium sp. CAP-1 TaxID=2676077 RepID=UPI0022A6A1B5|nr:AMP-binding protein [Sphingobium sp. CAP-1]